MALIQKELSRRGFLAGFGVAAGVITLTACGTQSGGGGGGGSDGSADLKMTVWGGEVDKKAYQDRIDLLVKKYPELKVTLALIPAANYAQKVQTMIAGGNGPDIMEVAENVNVYSSKSQIIPLDKYVSSAKLDLEAQFGPVGKAYSYQDKVYAIPDRSGAMILYYNKTLFEAKGIAAPTAAWTWDDMLSASKELTVPGSVWGFGGTGWWPGWWSMVYQNGGAIIDPETGKPTVDSDAVVEALQWCGDLIFKHHVVPTTPQYADMGPDMGGDQAFAAQSVAMNITGFWNVGTLAADPKLEWDLAPLWQQKKQAVAAFGSGLAISRDCKNPDAAFKAIAFLTAAKAQATIIESKQDVPASIEVQKSDTFLKPSWMTKPLNMAAFPESSKFVFKSPFIPEWDEMQKAFTDGLADFWLGKQQAAPALKAIQTQLTSIIKPAA
ncbi:sugar ABC transporter substrate-binding protein [Pengzhenrongella sp.]|jgi:multiple sugar transport system substrate-binding protein|uniref:ABC transporter substrate-binding protein n=1 Tax=Pengzhenrongella sp. TaxID=2888820 RepID=UPI002F929FAE